MFLGNSLFPFVLAPPAPIVYSPDAAIKFNSNPVAMFPVGNDASRFQTGYDDAIVVLYDGIGNDFYRVNQVSGAYTSHAFAAAAAAVRAVNESGDIYYMVAGNLFYKQQPDDVAKYFGHAASGEGTGEGANGIVQYARETGPDIASFASGACRMWTAIDYVAHTATLTSNSGAVFASEAAAGAPNIAGNTLYCKSGNEIGKVDTVSHVASAISSGTAATSTPVLAGYDGLLYGTTGPTLKQYDPSGVLLNTLVLVPTTPGATVRAAVTTDDGYVWCYAVAAGSTMDWWKIATGSLTFDPTLNVGFGILNAHGGLGWQMAAGLRFSDQTSPVLYTDNGGDFYIGKMVP